MRKTEERSVSGFDRVMLKDVGDVYITQGEVESLHIEADEEVLQRIQTDVANGRLVLGIKGDWLNWLSIGLGQLSHGAIRFNLQVKQLTGVEVMGAGRMYATRLEGQNLDVRLAGAGGIELTGLSVSALKVELPGAGKIELAGSADSQDVNLSGAGGYQAFKLETKRGVVRVSGVGNAAVNVQEDLEVHISGLGGVQYKGNPNLKPSIVGLGRLTKE
jgi:hypothetical protein